jgi:2-dehydro-3-deoxyphosphooctonate aldolase (KDO 8-P synthase)
MNDPYAQQPHADLNVGSLSLGDRYPNKHSMEIPPNPPPVEPPKVLLEDGTLIAQGYPLILIAGPCVIETREHSLYMAEQIQAICMQVGINFVFKSSFDKANRSSHHSYRGPGFTEGLDILNHVKETVGCPVITDIHESWQADQVARIVDIIQIPAFLCRQTDLLRAAANSGRPINLKKGQFVSPDDIQYPVEKLEAFGCDQIIITERGTCFGYNNLVVDYRSLITMRQLGYPVCFDATHSCQFPGGGTTSGGHGANAPALARAACTIPVDALFFEVHDDPTRALSDAVVQLPLSRLEGVLRDCLAVHELSLE